MIHNVHSNRQRSAFTLIELLTVMAIISILIAILMPALSGARTSSRMTKCQANLREITVATKQYATRNDDRFPVAGDCVNGSCEFWNGHQYVGWNGTQDRPHGGVWYRPVNIDLGLDPSPQNGKAAEIALCPSDIGAVGETGGSKPLFDVLGSSYIVNPILTQGNFGIWKYRNSDLNTSDVIQPSKAVLAADHVGFGITFDAAWTGINPGWHDRSRPVAVFGFVDGHAEPMKGRCSVREWQWYPDASGPAFVQNLSDKVDWQVYPGCE